MSEPIFRTWHFFWRMRNKKELNLKSKHHANHENSLVTIIMTAYLPYASKLMN